VRERNKAKDDDRQMRLEALKVCAGGAEEGGAARPGCCVAQDAEEEVCRPRSHPRSVCPLISCALPPLPHPREQAHDFEAYQEMLRAQAGASGAPAAGERYEQISKFLQGGLGGTAAHQ
jgi:hypothetical protein